MAKAVFTSKLDSGYDDVRDERYHFPQTYLNQAKKTVGDLIVYYEPRRGGRSSYTATARVLEISQDRQRPEHYYAHLAEYLDFGKSVPFQTNGSYFESALQKGDGTTNKGAFGRSVRLVPEHEFEAIISAGHMREQLLLSPVEETDEFSGFRENAQAEFERPLIESIVTRPYRDRAFVHQIRSAYDQRCALTGLRIINGGGRPEVQAAHIKPVSHNGSDWVRNGIALSGTVHWMFDRGLVTLDDDYRMITAKGMVPDEVTRLLNPDGYACLPEQESLRPLPRNLEYHRENIFKGGARCVYR